MLAIKKNQSVVHRKSFSCKEKQKGVSLFIVLIMLILGLISVLSAVRVGILNEAFVGNDVDAQRTFTAAEAMMRDAIIDVNGIKDDGSDCNTAVNASGCRVTTNPYIVNKQDGFVFLEPIRDILGAATCGQGVCVPRTGLMAPFWNNQAALNAMKPLAARYGQFTGATAAGNAILANRAWYWIEQYDYDPSPQPGGTKRLPVPESQFLFVMRITVLAEGNKPGTRTILQAYYVPRPVKPI